MLEDKTPDQPPQISLGELIQLNDSAQVESALEELSPVETARLISDIEKDDLTHLLEILGPEKSASIISRISGLGARIWLLN